MDNREREDVERLQEPVEIPEIVWSRADEAFAQIKQTEGGETMIKRTKKKMGIAILAVAMAGTVTVSAAVAVKWNERVVQEIEADDRQQKALEDKGMVADEAEPAVSDGITVKNMQTIADNHYIYMWFEITNENPDITLSEDCLFENFTCIIEGDGGAEQQLMDGESFEQTDKENVYTCVYRGILGSPDGDTQIGQGKVKMTLSGIHEWKDKLREERICSEGEWELECDLNVGDTVRTIEPKQAIPGYDDVVVDRIELSPISCTVYYADWAGRTENVTTDLGDGTTGESTLLQDPPYLVGFQMADGSMLTYVNDGPGMAGMVEGSDQYFESDGFLKVVDAQAITGLVYLKEGVRLSGEELPDESMLTTLDF